MPYLPHARFNSITVRLEHLKGLQSRQYKIRFNSITVRLELGYQLALNSAEKFQFHYGAIRTSYGLFLCKLALSFQFHYGAIRTYKTLKEYYDEAGFNSITVRLELGEDYSAQVQLMCFNSITVRLEHAFVFDHDPTDLRFNSITVRLERSAA